MSGEWDLIPTDLLPKPLKVLREERLALAAREGAAYEALLQAQGAVGTSAKADTAAHAQALRQSKPDPGPTQKAAAETALEKATRELAAIRQALLQNEADIIAELDENGADAVTALQAKMQKERVEGLQLLDNLSRCLLRFQQQRATAMLLMSPLGNDGEHLRRYNLRPLEVDMKAKNGTWEVAQRLLDLVGAQLELGAPAAELAIACREAEIDMDAGERLDRGRIRLDQQTTIETRKHGLVRYRVERNRQYVDLIVSVEHEQTLPLTDLLRAAKPQIEHAFANRLSVVVADRIAVATMAAAKDAKHEPPQWNNTPAWEDVVAGEVKPLVAA